MIKTTSILIQEFVEYVNPKDKIKRLVREGKLFPLVRGYYETDKMTPGYYLAKSIYGPSYLSFDFALSYYGLIPEAVYEFTSATYDKKKLKTYTNAFGTFTYRDVPKAVYPYGIRIVEENGYVFQIASPEKALCDKLYALSPISNQRELEELLFSNLRIDRSEFEQLDREQILSIANQYHCTNLLFFERYLRRKMQ